MLTCRVFFFFLFGIIPVFSLPQIQKANKKTPLQRFEYSHPQMGTVFRIVLYAHSATQAQAAAQAAFNRVDQLNQIMSDYIPDSELNQLSATAGTGKVIKLSADLWKILKISQEVARKTQGAFDVTVGPLVQLWRRTRRQQQLPSPEALTKAKAATGYQHLILSKKTRQRNYWYPVCS